ncbi:WD repeat-containing protein 25 [Osmerus eperlanus]|uniref:WD repeat-containing protein 25 n=1 Tax=Osmerus eperlanus TaxID=29151 RepID=UPI002E103F8A
MHNMASLVTYEDSDPEDDSVEDEKRVPPLATKCANVQRPSQRYLEVVGSHYGLIPHPQPNTQQSNLWTETALGSSETVEYSTKPCLLSPQRIHTHEEQVRRRGDSQNPPRPAPPSVSSGTAISCAVPPPYISLLPPPSQRPMGVATIKKQHQPPAGIRPYISKRQRLATPGDRDGPGSYLDKAPEDQTPSLPREDQTPASRIQAPASRQLSEVSEIVRPYLGHRPGKAQVPRSVQLSMQAHLGPVNTVQWCPVPHISHLLLSASMDKTVKVWDAAESGRCLMVYASHTGAVRAAHWSPCGRRILTGSFDSTAMVTDVETGQQIVKVGTQFRVMCLAVQPSDPDVFLCGGYSPEVKAWDSRTGKVESVFRAGVQQTLDVLFLSGGREFISSSDCVSRDSAELTLMAWDFRTTARLSNQIFHERYTCPSLALHPVEEGFVAQTNGNYMALFSGQRPYRMNKRRRYEGHKVEGYAVRCDFSQDGTILATGSSTGSVHLYDFQSSRTLHILHGHEHPCVAVSLHPTLPAVAATCDWGGQVRVWN